MRNNRLPPNWPPLAYPVYDAAVRVWRFFTPGQPPLHRREGFRPFFIVGSGRSGNTLLRRMLQACPDVHIPPETYVLRRAIQLFLRNRYMPWRDLVYLVLSWFEFHREADRFGVCLRPVAIRMADLPPERRSLACLLNGFYVFHAESIGKSAGRWGDKTPFNAFALPWLLRVFPDARFVHMVRDAVDVVHSYLDAGLSPDARAAARRWVASIRAVDRFSRRHPDRCIEVRYEAMVTDPAATLERVCRFLDVPYEPAMVESLDHVDDMPDLRDAPHMQRAARPVSTDSIGKGRRQLTADQKASIAPVIERELGRLGYDSLS